jgi:hypothetical protein
MYVNGTASGTTSTWNTNFNIANIALFRKFYNTASNYLVGNLSVIKISKKAFYKTNFTPLKKIYSNDIATILLLNVADVSSQSKYLTDSSSYNVAMTNSNVYYSGVYKPA